MSRYTLLLLTRGGAGPGHVAQLEHEAAHEAAEDGEQVGRGEAEHQHRELPVTELGPSEYTSQWRSSSSTLLIYYWYVITVHTYYKLLYGCQSSVTTICIPEEHDGEGHNVVGEPDEEEDGEDDNVDAVVGVLDEGLHVQLELLLRVQVILGHQVRGEQHRVLRPLTRVHKHRHWVTRQLSSSQQDSHFQFRVDTFRFSDSFV